MSPPPIQESIDPPMSGDVVRGQGGVADGERVGAGLVPVLQHQAVRCEEAPDHGAVPPGDLLQDRDQDAEPVIAQYGALGNRVK
ncbi:MAG: hypothetical protein ABI037_04870 [Gemmatimonadales bacterium]